jgi:KDO2-lipid IV(A) lauroyltransferase
MSETTPNANWRGQPLSWGERPPSWWERALYPLEYGLFRLVTGLFWVLGLERASALGGWIGRSIGPKLSVSRRAHRNLKLAMPELTRAEREAIVYKMWDNLGRTFAEYPHLEQFWALKPGARIEIAGIEHAYSAIAKGKGGLFVSGHLGNWEIMPMCVRHAGLEGGIVYRPPNNPYVDRWITAQRMAHCLPTMAPKGPEGAKVIIQLLKKNAFIAMLVDQKMNNGIEVPFFGHPAMTTQAAAQLSLKYGAPLVAVKNERLGGPRFRVTIYPEITIEPTGDRAADIRALTIKLNAFLEARIREAPEMWLWLHSRWPKEATRNISLAD